jgi:hypothetical protein
MPPRLWHAFGMHSCRGAMLRKKASASPRKRQQSSGSPFLATPRSMSSSSSSFTPIQRLMSRKTPPPARSGSPWGRCVSLGLRVCLPAESSRAPPSQLLCFDRPLPYMHSPSLSHSLFPLFPLPSSLPLLSYSPSARSLTSPSPSPAPPPNDRLHHHHNPHRPSNQCIHNRGHYRHQQQPQQQAAQVMAW